MSKTMKKIFALVIAGVFALSMCACGSTAEEQEGETGIANPFFEVEGTDELCEATGISIEAPEGATDVVYSYCQGSEEVPTFAQVVFTLDGVEYTYRCQDAGSLTDITEGAEPADLIASLADCTNPGAALAGMYYNWECGGTTEVQGRDAVFGVDNNGPGMIAWLDVVPGFLYSLSADDGATQASLTELAESIFVCMQGEC